MIAEHNCFPADWIGKRLVKGNDWTYFVDGDSSKQVSIPSGYGKPTSARWLPNGVLRMDSDGETKFFFVGSQRFFMAYGNETEPHDRISFEEAVKECKRLRAEEAERNSPRQYSRDDNNSTSNINIGKSKGSGLGFGAMIGGSSILKKNPFDRLSKDEIEANRYLDELEERRREEQREREREEENRKYFEERDQYKKRLGEDFDKREPLQQLESILEVYKNGGSEEMTFDFLKGVIEGDYDEKKKFFKEFVKQYKDCMQDIIPEKWAKKILEAFPYIYRYKYLELKRTDENEPNFGSDDESESKGFFDFSTNLKNKKIKGLKKNIKNQSWDYTSKKDLLRDYLINCEKEIREYKELIDNLNDTEKFLKSNSVGFFKSFTLSKEEKDKIKNAEDKKKQLKEKILHKKEEIVRLNKNIKEQLEKVLKVEDIIKKDYSELFELTNNIEYSQEIGIKGDGLLIAKQISKNVNKTDLDYYRSLFRI